MPDKGSTGAVGTVEGDRQLDTADEVGDTVFKEMVGNLHDARRMLNDGDFRTRLEF